MWLGGVAAREALSVVRDPEQAMAELTEPEFWLTPCQSYGIDADASAGLLLTTAADGGFPGARGVDDAGRTVAAMISTALLPWSQLGIPGEPPSEASEV